jgi:phosphohistidine phosphatase SixA
MPTTLSTLAVALVLTAAVQSIAPAWAHAQRAIVLVRHAEKADSSEDPPLSAEGEARAGRLAEMLRSLPIARLYATRFQRTQGTLAPLARVIGREVTVFEGDAAALARELRAAGPDDVLVCAGHSNTVPRILQALGHPETVTIDDEDYSNLFLVVPAATGPPTVLRLRY